MPRKKIWMIFHLKNAHFWLSDLGMQQKGQENPYPTATGVNFPASVCI